MSGRGGRQLTEYQGEGGGDRPGKCARFLKCTWKLCTCVFSHTLLISLVVTYCILGAFTFEKLEAGNERMVKESIGYIRGNMTEEIWELTKASNVLHQENWTNAAIVKLKKFEKELMIAIKKNGWDGNNDMSTMQWTFAGALFYSIIVITTIGYGHIAPKTHWGKVVTIFYAILGIPLMLLCLSNIGDIMATSFRFLYWRVCCYVCTKRPRRKKSARRARSGRGTIRYQGSRYDRGRGTSFRKSGRTSTRSADSGFGLSEVTPSSYSDTECRYNGETGVGIQRILRPSQISRFSDSAAPSTSGGVAPAVPGGGRVLQNVVRGGSLDRRRRSDGGGHGVPLRTPVLCNRYAVDREVAAGGDLDNIQVADAERLNKPKLTQRSLSVPRQEFLEPPGGTFEAPTRKRDRRRGHHPPSPRIMSPMGFAVQRQPTYVDEDDDDDDDYEDGFDVEYGGSGGSESRRNVVMKPVPIWLCVFLVVSYILAGAWLFNKWEGWDYLDSAYFCFITLTTIGFGDFVPAKRVTQDAEISIALCSLYLLFGIALLAMSFNLVQEEVIANVKSVAKRLGIIKDDEEHEEED